MSTGPMHRLAGMLGHQEARRADLQRIDDFVIKHTKVTGFVEVVIDASNTIPEGTG